MRRTIVVQWSNWKSRHRTELTTWLPGMMEHYVAERIKAGENADVAQRMSEAQFAELFPDGCPADGQYVMNVVDDE